MMEVVMSHPSLQGLRRFTLVTRDTRELDFAHHRQMFLTEQGYSYSILDSADLLAEAVVS